MFKPRVRVQIATAKKFSSLDVELGLTVKFEREFFRTTPVNRQRRIGVFILFFKTVRAFD